MRSSPELPPLHALRAFEAVVRHGSFRKAAADLLVSPSVISHHIRELETHLGLLLIERQSRGIRLTPAGSAYHDIVSAALETLRGGTRRLLTEAAPRRLRITLLASFATYWLLPRLPLLNASLPEITLDLDPGLDVVDIEDGRYDLAIRFGIGPWPHGQSSLLMAESLTPLAAPYLLDKARRGEPLPLLSSAGTSYFQHWHKCFDLEWPADRLYSLRDYAVTVEAARHGQGLLLGRLRLLASLVNGGALTAPWPERIHQPPGLGHWLVTPRQSRHPHLRPFLGWLRQQADLSPLPVLPPA
jgi:LysR family glycine cleavage system transcriptional activator